MMIDAFLTSGFILKCVLCFCLSNEMRLQLKKTCDCGEEWERQEPFILKNIVRGADRSRA